MKKLFFLPIVLMLAMTCPAQQKVGKSTKVQGISTDVNYKRAKVSLLHACRAFTTLDSLRTSDNSNLEQNRQQTILAVEKDAETALKYYDILSPKYKGNKQLTELKERIAMIEKMRNAIADDNWHTELAWVLLSHLLKIELEGPQKPKPQIKKEDPDRMYSSGQVPIALDAAWA